MGDATLSINNSVQKGIHIVTLTGELDAHTVPLLKANTDKLVSSGAVNIVFDFAALSYISSAGIGLLNATLSTLKSKNGKIAISGANKTITDTLEVMYFTKKADLLRTIDDAVKSF